MKNIDDKILEDIKNDTDNIQIPESLSPDNMMAKIAKKKEEGYFAVEENKEKNGGKKNNTKLAALLSSSAALITGSAALIAAASLGLVLLGTGIIDKGNKGEGSGNNIIIDKSLYHNYYNCVSEEYFEGEKVNTLSSYDRLVDYYYAKGSTQIRYPISNIKGEIYDDGDLVFGDAFPGADDLVTNDGIANENEGTKEETSNPDYSDTNVRTENVAEADIVKTDGKYIYYLSCNYYDDINYKNESDVIYFNDIMLKIVKADGADSKAVCEMSLLKDIRESLSEVNDAAYYQKEMMLYDDKLVVVCTDSLRTVVAFYDISDKSKPEHINTLYMDGEYDSCRLVDGHLYVFSERYMADDLTIYNWKSATNREKITKEIIPQTSEGQLDAKDVYVSNCEDFNYYHMIGAVDMNDTASFKQVKAVLGQYGGVLYVSAENIYYIDRYFESYTYNEPGTIVDMTNKSEIIRLSYKDGNIEATGKTIIEGEVGDEFAIDEYNGYLRFAVTVARRKGKCGKVDIRYYNGKTWIDEEIIDVVDVDYSEYKEVSALYVLDDKLQVVGSIPDLKEDERVYGVRFDGDIAYVVTYRQMDPLFTIDLSNPAEPKVIGALKIPGFSTYLHKWGENKLIGIGHEDGWQVKISTFDITDKTDVKEVDVCVLEDVYGADALYNHKAVFVSPEKNLFGFATNSGEYKVFRYVGDTLTEVINCEMYLGRGDEARGLYIGDYIYIVGQNSGVFVYNISDFAMVTEVK